MRSRPSSYSGPMGAAAVIDLAPWTPRMKAERSVAPAPSGCHIAPENGFRQRFLRHRPCAVIMYRPRAVIMYRPCAVIVYRPRAVITQRRFPAAAWDVLADDPGGPPR